MHNQQLLSHEIRTPLALIKGAAELLASTELNDEQRQLLGIIESNIVRSVGMAEAFLTVARITQPGFQASLEESDLRELVRSTTQELRSVATCPILNSDSGNPLPAVIDTALLRQALWNVIGNAATHAPEGHHIGVSTYANGPSVVVQISDTGPGMSPTVKDRMLEPFGHYGSGSSGLHGGKSAGLGMSITKEIMDIHHGRILVETIEGQGTTIFLVLPAPGSELDLSREML